MERELRIGNLLHDKKGKLCRVEGLGIEQYHEIDAPAIHGALTSLPHTPIPLTEEWLLKFGFDNKCYEVIYDNTLGCYNFAVYNMGGDKVVCASPEYVHQLQNLYFALSGEELTM